jgi:hypothetical protein
MGVQGVGGDLLSNLMLRFFFCEERCCLGSLSVFLHPVGCDCVDTKNTHECTECECEDAFEGEAVTVSELARGIGGRTLLVDVVEERFRR